MRVVKSYEEVGSGMCDTRLKLHQLFKLVEEKQINKVVVEHKDRLIRFNFKFLEAFFASHGVEVEWMEEVLGKKYEDELVEEELLEFSGPKHEHDVVGVDLGIKTLATISDGEIYDNPKPLKRKLKKLRRLQRAVSRKIKGSANRRKAVQKVARLHHKISNIRKDALHKMTTALAKTKRVIGIEDLNVSGMTKNRKLARAIADLGLFELRRQLTYKGTWYDCLVKVVDRFFPSSKGCHVCGDINEKLTLADREWTCEGCGTHHDRDYNASCNLEIVAASLSET